MVRRILLLVLLAGLSQLAKAQCTPNDTITRTGFFPSQLSPGVAGQPYSETMTVVLISDTTIDYNGFPAAVIIDSAILVDVVNLPPKFGYNCETSDCKYLPKKPRCAEVYGQPGVDDLREDTIGLVIRMHGKAFGTIVLSQTDTLWRFVIKIEKNTASIRPILEGLFIYPNPSSDGAFTFSQVLDEVRIFDAMGRQVPFKYDGVELKLEQPLAGFYYLKAVNSHKEVIHNKLHVQ